MHPLARLFDNNRAWVRGQSLEVHGWIYGLSDGLLRDLGVGAARADQIGPRVETALAQAGLRGGRVAPINNGVRR